MGISENIQEVIFDSIDSLSKENIKKMKDCSKKFLNDIEVKIKEGLADQAFEQTYKKSLKNYYQNYSNSKNKNLIQKLDILKEIEEYINKYQKEINKFFDIEIRTVYVHRNGNEIILVDITDEKNLYKRKGGDKLGYKTLSNKNIKELIDKGKEIDKIKNKQNLSETESLQNLDNIYLIIEKRFNVAKNFIKKNRNQYLPILNYLNGKWQDPFFVLNLGDLKENYSYFIFHIPERIKKFYGNISIGQMVENFLTNMSTVDNVSGFLQGDINGLNEKNSEGRIIEYAIKSAGSSLMGKLGIINLAEYICLESTTIINKEILSKQLQNSVIKESRNCYKTAKETATILGIDNIIGKLKNTKFY